MKGSGWGGFGEERREARSLNQLACSGVCFSVNQEKVIPSMPVPGTLRGPGDAGRTGQTGPLLPALTPPLLVPLFRDGSPSVGSYSILSSTLFISC